LTAPVELRPLKLPLGTECDPSEGVEVTVGQPASKLPALARLYKLRRPS
jgi:hypothetical protein